MSALSAPATALLEHARGAQHAADLYLRPEGARATAEQIAELLHGVPAAHLDERTAWNLFFSAGELSLRVDVYQAHALFRAAAALVARLSALAPPPGDPRAVAAEMAFDFFFARDAHPLLPLKRAPVLATLGELLEGGRVGARAALHGLGHLVALARGAGLGALGEEAGALVERFGAREGLDPSLRALAADALAGTLP